MRANQVKIGGHYICRVSGKLVTVKINRVSATGKGWIATNLTTDRQVHISSGGRLQREA